MGAALEARFRSSRSQVRTRAQAPMGAEPAGVGTEAPARQSRSRLAPTGLERKAPTRSPVGRLDSRAREHLSLRPDGGDQCSRRSQGIRRRRSPRCSLGRRTRVCPAGGPTGRRAACRQRQAGDTRVDGSRRTPSLARLPHRRGTLRPTDGVSRSRSRAFASLRRLCRCVGLTPPSQHRLGARPATTSPHT
jgi:hypothetical protein